MLPNTPPRPPNSSCREHGCGDDGEFLLITEGRRRRADLRGGDQRADRSAGAANTEHRKDDRLNPDSGLCRGIRVGAHSIDLSAIGRLRQRDPGDARHGGGDPDRPGQAEEGRSSKRLHRVALEDHLGFGEVKREAAADKQSRKRDNERGNAQARDEAGIDRAESRADQYDRGIATKSETPER